MPLVSPNHSASRYIVDGDGVPRLCIVSRMEGYGDWSGGKCKDEIRYEVPGSTAGIGC
jgi:hypothetical protein